MILPKVITFKLIRAILTSFLVCYRFFQLYYSTNKSEFLIICQSIRNIIIY